MRITGIRVIVSCPGRNFVTPRIDTDQGLHGIGDATLNGRELAVAAYLREHVAPCLIGRDARRIEDTWQYLYRGAYWRRGPVTMCAIAAVDVALWDIKAKAAGMPLYDLLGGASRDACLAYAHADGPTPEAAGEAALALIEQGWRAVRVQGGLPDLPDVYGTGAGGSGDLPREERWDTPLYLRHAPRLLEAARAAVGDRVHLLHDVHHRLTPIEAARLACDLEPARLFWLEDPVAAELQAGFRAIRQHSTTPIATGEVFNSVWDAKTLIEEGLIDYLRSAPVHAGGITHLRRMADLSALHHVRTGFHGAEDMSPVSLTAGLHLGLALPNFGIQEYAGHSPETAAVFPHAYRLEAGRLHPGDAPGHGVDIDEGLAERFPYQRSYLPVARLEDGTLWNW